MDGTIATPLVYQLHIRCVKLAQRFGAGYEFVLTVHGFHLVIIPGEAPSGFLQA